MNPVNSASATAPLECVVNVSEGLDPGRIAALAAAGGADLLDVHRDADHHRSVFTLIGADAPRRLARTAVELLDITAHEGVHPRLGVVDVVPFVDLSHPREVTIRAVSARDAFASWIADELGVPAFLYGPLPDGSERTLPEVRRRAFVDLPPDHGPMTPHRSAGAVCVGARPVLVAYNVWLPRSVDAPTVRSIAADVRRPGLRSLGLMVGGRPQVSMNLVEPWTVTPADAYDAVVEASRRRHVAPDGAELVGLVPEEVLEAVAKARWQELDLSPDRTIEARLLTASA